MGNSDSYLGKVIGNYRIVAELGSGSFGVVYRGEHNFLPNRVGAIKLMHAAHLDSWQDRESFLLEARLLEMLKHPHILPILDVGIHEGFPYLVTEYAPNGSLRDRLQQIYPWMLPIKESIKILSQIGEALNHAHQQNIIHRDLKPANILFNARGDALLADFGIATTLATASIKFVEASGSPPYMAPEQFQGTISKESDQYSLGCIAYELFTGRRPFVSPDPFTIGFKHLTENPAPLTMFNPQIPPQVEKAVLKSLAKQRTDRFADIAAFIGGLNAAPLYHVQPSTTPTGENEPTLLAPMVPDRGKTNEQAPIMPAFAAEHIQKDDDTAKRLHLREEDLPTLRSQNKPPVEMLYLTPEMQGGGRQAGPISGGGGPVTPFPGDITPLPGVSPAAPGQNAFVAAPPSPPIITTMPATINAGSTSKKDRRKRVYAIMLTALALLIVAASVFYVVVSVNAGGPVSPLTILQPKPTATVTITPLSKDAKNTYTIALVTGQPDASQKQASGARILASSESQSLTVNATGHGVIPATNASGTLVFSNPVTTFTESAGSTISGKKRTLLIALTIKQTIWISMSMVTIEGFVLQHFKGGT
jgi:serine/threonine protein kinase